MLRPLHLLDDCKATSVDVSGATDVVICENAAGGRARHHFDRTSGLLVKQEITGARSLTVTFDDYRLTGGMRVPFKTHINVGGVTIRYNASSIVHNTLVDSKVFQKPSA